MSEFERDKRRLSGEKRASWRIAKRGKGNSRVIRLYLDNMEIGHRELPGDSDDPTWSRPPLSSLLDALDILPSS